MRSSIFILGSFLMACGSGDGTVPDGGDVVDAGHVDGSVDHNTTPSDAAVDGAVDSTPTVDAATCTTCPQGYACGTANGLPVCRSTTTDVPLFSNVYVIVMENTSLS